MKYVNFAMVFVVLTTVLALNAHAEGSLQELIKEAWQRQQNMEVVLGVVLKMQREGYLRGNKRHSKEDYEKLVFDKELNCLLCHRAKGG